MSVHFISVLCMNHHAAANYVMASTQVIFQQLEKGYAPLDGHIIGTMNIILRCFDLIWLYIYYILYDAVAYRIKCRSNLTKN